MRNRKQILFSILLFSTILFACGREHKTVIFERSDAWSTPTPSPTPHHHRVEIQSDPDQNTDDEDTLLAAVEEKMDAVNQSNCVHNFLSSRQMIQTNGKTSNQVADEVHAAQGSVPVQFYYEWTSTIAYRQPPYPTVHLNRRFVGSQSSVCYVLSILAHEMVGHVLLGYDHDVEWSPSREYSVPYSINHAIDTGDYNGSDSGGCCIN